MGDMSIRLEEIRRVTALRHLSEDCQRGLAEVMVRRTFAPGEMIFIEGEQALGIWFVLSGRVRILKHSMTGRSQALCIAQSGKCFGTCPLFSTESNPASAQALDDVTLLVLPDDQATALMRENPCLVKTLLQLYSERLDQLARLSECLAMWTVARRLNDSLLNNAVPDPPYLIVHLTHEKLAELAGTVREVASRHLEKLAEHGVVELHSGYLYIIQPLQLQ
ncbi:MAG: Crp/Fnr family transcriptional regulator [Chloroflexi bacterium]|nr:Crp/Fnr family transcriptional regulator [Chloroflexota bacterium]